MSKPLNPPCGIVHGKFWTMNYLTAVKEDCDDELDSLRGSLQEYGTTLADTVSDVFEIEAAIDDIENVGIDFKAAASSLRVLNALVGCLKAKICAASEFIWLVADKEEMQQALLRQSMLDKFPLLREDNVDQLLRYLNADRFIESHPEVSIDSFEAEEVEYGNRMYIICTADGIPEHMIRSEQ